MRCEDFLAALPEWIDGELDATRIPDLKEHVRTCSACASENETAREAARWIGDAVRETFDLRPDPEQRAEFIDRFSRPPARLIPILTVVAAVGLFAVTAILLMDRPSPFKSVTPAPIVLEDRVQEGLARLASYESGGDELLDSIIAMEVAAIEEGLVDDEPVGDLSLDEAAAALASTETRERVAAKRALARAEPEALVDLKAEDSYVRALQALGEARARPFAEGKPVVMIHQVRGEGVLQFEQYANGSVHMVATESNPPKTTDVWANDVYELMATHPAICQRFGIIGEAGEIQIGSGIKSLQTLRASLSGVRESIAQGRRDEATSKLDRMKIEVITRRTGDVDEILRRVEEKLRAEPTPASHREAVRRAFERIRRLEILCEELQGLK